MEFPLVVLCIVYLLWQLWYILTKGLPNEDQGDQDKRDKGELPYGYFERKK